MGVSTARLTLSLMLFASAVLCAQERDNRGTEFWVSFLENHGSGSATETSDLRLYIASASPTTARLVYNRTGQEFTVDIAQANVPVEVDVRNVFGEGVEINGGEPLSRKTITVFANDPITLYGVNVRTMSADAFVALPVDVLTRRYIVLAYQNGVLRSQGFSSVDMPSQFCVIATEDGTLVRVVPNAPINGRGTDAFTVGLNRGDVYFAQAQLDRQWDLSGTTVQSTKPVAVFSGTRRTAIPARIGIFRNHLIEQMPPLEVWGKEAIVTPHFTITPTSREDAIVRVLAAYDGTEWSIDGVRQTPLMRSRPAEIPLTRAMRIVADRPILVAQYEHSVNTSDPDLGGFALGDPFMMIVPPPEQFDTAYAFQSVGHSEFHNHFINVVVPIAGASTLRLDGAPIAAILTPIGGTRFGYFQFELTSGAHTIRADSAFGLFSYGFGPATAYGYTGGMRYRTLVHDYEPPTLSERIECSRISGTFRDDQITDSGIDSCAAGAGIDNVRLTIDPFKSAADSVTYRAELVDPYRDGVASIRAVDSAGRSRTKVTQLAGLTVRAAIARDNAPVTLDTLEIVSGLRSCIAIEIENVGGFEQYITGIRLSSGILTTTISQSMPLLLAPGERRTIDICAQAAGDIVAAVDVILSTDCADRLIAKLPVIAFNDRDAPLRVGDVELCGSERTLRFSEAGARSSGIAMVVFDSLVNCTVDWVTPSTLLTPARTLECHVTVFDTRRDAFITTTLSDRSGNTSRFADTLAGFTCAIVDGRADTLSNTAGAAWRIEGLGVGGRKVDSFAIVNYGTQTQRIVAATFARNEFVSIPPSQLPIVLARGERRAIAVYLDARYSGTMADTLTLIDACGRTDQIAVEALVPIVTGSGEDRCNNALRVSSIGPTKRSFVSVPVPNPSRGGTATIDIGLDRGGDVSLEILDASGEIATTVFRGIDFREGLHRVVADLATLSSGRYFVRLNCPAGTFVEQLVVVR